MYFFDWFSCLYENEYSSCLTLVLGVVGLLLSFAYACLLQSKKTYVALSLLVSGYVGCAMATRNSAMNAELGVTSLVLVCGVSLYMILALILWLEKRRVRKSSALEREKYYALPERNNEYIRTRLSAVFQDVGGAEFIKKPMETGYVKALLCELQSMPLSSVERLQAEELQKRLYGYFRKGHWSLQELRSVNELCGDLLKLRAKYEVDSQRTPPSTF